MIEVWRAIPGYPGYQASDLGNIRSLARTLERSARTGQLLTRKEKILKPFPIGAQKRRAVHFPGRRIVKCAVLVLLAFEGPRPSPRHCALHWDDNPLNDRADNLRWGTRSENADDAIRNGRQMGWRSRRDPILPDAETVTVFLKQ